MVLREMAKTRYTATYRAAKYIGTHPHIKDTTGVYYWSSEQGSFVFRPDIEDEDMGKTDWFRVHRENLIDI